MKARRASGALLLVAMAAGACALLPIAGDKRFIWVRTSRGLERWAGVRDEPGCM
jgi:hypothetical protein